jgi:hypothetical protein
VPHKSQAEDNTQSEQLHACFRQSRKLLMRSRARVGLSGTPFLIALSMIIGFFGDIGSLVFRWLIDTFELLFLTAAQVLESP